MSIETTGDKTPQEAYQAYMEARGLRPVNVSSMTLDEYTPMMSTGPTGARGDGATGALLGELPATLLHSTYSEARGQASSGDRFTLVVATISEAVAFARNLSCRDRAVQKKLAHTEIARFGDSREIKLESIEFDRRFALQAPPGIDASWLRQLFTPALLVWLASKAPAGFCFELNEGHYCAAIPGHATEPAALDPFLAAAGQVAQRIREEALEGAGHSSQAAALTRDKRFERMLAKVEFSEPPPDVASATDRYMGRAMRRPSFIVRAIGNSFRSGAQALLFALVILAILAVSSGGNWLDIGINAAVWLIPLLIGGLVLLWLNVRRQAKALATRLGEEAFVRGYARSRRLEIVDAARFQVEHATLRLPGAARHVMVGPLPGTDVRGAIALVDAGVEKAAELSASTGQAIMTGAMSWFGMGADDDRTYDAAIFDAPGAAFDTARLDALAAAAANAATQEEMQRSMAGIQVGQGLDLSQMMGAFRAWQGGASPHFVADGTTLACVRAVSRGARSAAGLDSMCRQAASVAATTAGERAPT